MTQFEKHAYYDASTLKNTTGVQLKGGYWDQNVRNPGYIMPRDGGKHYIDAWQKIDRNSVDRIYVESWNEYDEGSGIYATQITDPYLPEDTAAKRSDFWSANGDPFEYIKTTAKYSALFNDALAYNARVIGEKIPRTMKRGETAKAQITVLNTGNVSWNEASGVKLVSKDGSFLAAPVAVDDSTNEINRYGGIFRGRPIAFDALLKAPDTAGTYMLRVGMADNNGNAFGYYKSAEITVE